MNLNKEELKKAHLRYNQQRLKTTNRVDASGIKIQWMLTFEQWIDIWDTSSKWQLRGRGRGKYCMSRYDDKGNYEIGNIEIITFEKNCKIRQKVISNYKEPVFDKVRSAYSGSAKSCSVDGVIYKSAAEAARALKVTRGAVWMKIKSDKWANYKYI